MAPRKTKAAEVEETTEEETAEEATPTSRSQMAKHEALAAYIEAEAEVSLSDLEPAEVIALAFKHRNAWRKTSDYLDNFKSQPKEEKPASKTTKGKGKAAAKSTTTRSRKGKAAATNDDAF